MCVILSQESLKQRVICDTNVWYTLAANGTAEFCEILSKYQLILTNISLVEMLSSFNITQSDESFQKIRDAFIVVSKYAKFQSANDVEYIMCALGIDFIDEEHFNIQEKYDNLLVNFIEANTKEDLNYNYETQIKERESFTNTFVECLNDCIEQWRKKDVQVSIDEIRKELIYMLKTDMYNYASHHKIYVDSFPFSEEQIDSKISVTFDLYLTAFSEFIYRVYKQKNMRIKPNDYVDFRNLIYCQKESRYLTFESSKGERVGGILQTHCKSYLIPNIDKLRAINEDLSRKLLDEINKKNTADV